MRNNFYYLKDLKHQKQTIENAEFTEKTLG